MRDDSPIRSPSAWRWASVVILVLLAVLGGLVMLFISFGTIMASDGCGTSSGGDSTGTCVARVGAAFFIPWVGWFAGLILGVVGLVRSWGSGRRAGVWGPAAVAIWLLGVALAAVILFVL